MISKDSFYIINESLGSISKDPLQLRIDLHAPTNNDLNFQLFYSPDQLHAVTLVKTILENNMGRDLGLNIHLESNFVLWHCSECEDKGFNTTKTGCWSGGRYCYYRSSDFTNSDFYLSEILHQICLNKIITPVDHSKNSSLSNNDIEDLKKYYSGYLTNFVKSENFEKLDSNWINRVDLALDPEFTKKLQGCFTKSFQPKIAGKVNPSLDDNTYLAEELEKFKKVAGYENFPLLKINGIQYNGKLDWNSVMVWVCQELMVGETVCNGIESARLKMVYLGTIVIVFLT
jgi:hypothetical protein